MIEIRFSGGAYYLSRMRSSAFEPCIPTRGTKVPTSKNWLREIKHDGYRLIVQREGKRVRLFTGNGSTGAIEFEAMAKPTLTPLHGTQEFYREAQPAANGTQQVRNFFRVRR
jgi:hypothetical protein